MDIKNNITNIILSVFISTLLFSFLIDYRKIKSLEWTTKTMAVSINKTKKI